MSSDRRITRFQKSGSRIRHRVGAELNTNSSEASGQLPPIGSSLPTGETGGGSLRAVRRVREIPAESSTWLQVALALFGIAFVAATFALTEKDPASISVGEWWIISGALAAIGLVCLAAHWDANRGRKVKQSDVIEEWEEPKGPPTQ
jgi:peptidoglycan/LPS O-acetylase OafA/YrhL